MTAAALGFDRPMANSLDAVSDRDFALEFLRRGGDLRHASQPLRRGAGDLVLGAVPLRARSRDRFSTGSSIMPQKRNPDAAELVRAKVGRITGALVALLTVMKGLPLAYSKDMQEDKEQVFDAADALMLALAAMTGHGRATWRRDARAAARGGGGGLLDRDRPRRLAGARGSGCRSARRTTSPARW